jgi:hypothetical protein
MKIKVSVIGNCQARPIARLLKDVYKNVDISTVAIVHLLKEHEKDEYMRFFRESDFILTQNIADNYPCSFIRTSYITECFGSKVLKFHNLYYRGYNPELTYIRLKGKGTLKGPLGDYHHKILLDSWRENLKIDEAIFRVKSYDHWESKFSMVHQQSLSELISREKNLDITIVQEIEEWLSDERLFFTFNHPSLKLIYMQTLKIASKMQLEKNCEFVFNPNNEPLNQLIAPISNYVKNQLKIRFDESETFKALERNIDGSYTKLKYYSLDMIANEYYELYDTNKKLILDYGVNLI